MSYDSKLIKKLGLTKKTLNAVQSAGKTDDRILDMMSDPRYLRQSSSLINEALQKGYDVLQLADGDIVTTGTKTVVYQYSWDAEKGKLVKVKTESSKRIRRALVEEPEEEDA